MLLSSIKLGTTHTTYRLKMQYKSTPLAPQERFDWLDGHERLCTATSPTPHCATAGQTPGRRFLWP